MSSPLSRGCDPGLDWASHVVSGVKGGSGRARCPLVGGARAPALWGSAVRQTVSSRPHRCPCANSCITGPHGLTVMRGVPQKWGRITALWSLACLPGTPPTRFPSALLLHLGPTADRLGRGIWGRHHACSGWRGGLAPQGSGLPEQIARHRGPTEQHGSPWGLGKLECLSQEAETLEPASPRVLAVS